MPIKHLWRTSGILHSSGTVRGQDQPADALLFEAHASIAWATWTTAPRRRLRRRGTQHHFSIDTHVLHADHDGKHLNILDAPGSPDFIARRSKPSPLSKRPSSSCPRLTAWNEHRRMFKEATDSALAGRRHQQTGR